MADLFGVTGALFMQDMTSQEDVAARIRERVGESSSISAGDFIDELGDPAHEEPNWGIKASKSKGRVKQFLLYSIILVLISSVTFIAGQFSGAKQSSNDNTALILRGGQTIDEKQLRHIVTSRGLTVYWLGSKAGTRYLLNTSNPGGISLRCISASGSTSANGASETYYEVGTFTSQNAFALTQKAALQANGVGFVNVDGNAVYYDSRDPKNVYIGLKGADIQVEVFDPRPDQALAAALLQGHIQRIS